jgi:TolA-binding protein
MDVYARRTFMKRGFLMIASMKMNRTAFAAFALLTAASPAVHAQDVPGIEICTVEKTMERRTSCLQSNVDFLQKTINKLSADHQQKIDAANRQIEALKVTVAGLQKVIADLQAAQKQMADDLKKQAEPAKGATAPAKEGAK